MRRLTLVSLLGVGCSAAESTCGAPWVLQDDGRCALGGEFAPDETPTPTPVRTPTPTASPSPSPTPTPVDTEVVDTEVVDTDPPDLTTIPAALEGVNLLENPGGELGDLLGWTLDASGGDGWQAFEVSGAHGGLWEVRTSFGLCQRSQEIDLVAAGFTAAQLDAEPEVRVSEWLRERCQTGDAYQLGVQLLDAAGAVLDTYEVSDVTTNASTGCDYADDVWFELAHTFRGYGAGLRTIRFRDGGQDSEFWAGHYGITMDDAHVSLHNP